MRYQSAVPNRRGVHPGVFALANGLASAGVLDVQDHAAWQQANEIMNAAYPHPTASDPSCYDPVEHPGAVAWFKAEPAAHLIDLTRWYLALLDRYRVPWVELRTTAPGRVHFEDAVQVVATPFIYPQDWPLPPTPRHTGPSHHRGT